MSDELPKLFSDEEFDAQRELADRRTKERRVARMRTDGHPESTIEQRFPHIPKKLTALWRSEACAVYLSGLSISIRPSRQGFPLDVIEDLLMLYEINEMLMEKSGSRQAAASPPAWGKPVGREHD